MNSDIIALLIVFATIFGIVYLIIASRSRIRLALIEKGADASIFSNKSSGGGNVLSIILANLALLLFSIGIAIFFGAILSRNFGVAEEVAFPGAIFTLAGLGLFAGFKITSKIGKEDRVEVGNAGQN